MKCPKLWTPSLLALTLVLVAGAAYADCDHEADREATVDADGVRLIEIDAGAGTLEVEGREGATRVEARGTACASRESALDEIRIATRRSGDRLRVVAEIPDGRYWDEARLDLEVSVPAGVAVKVDDGSGSLRVRKVGSLEIDDGSGSIDVEDVAGDVEIDDGSGEIDVRGVGGEVRINDGSGSIDVRRAGAVVIEDDGSGEIDLAEIDGDVLVRSDGSGSISARDVGGDFTVRRDGSGGIRYDRVAGRVSVPERDR